MSIQVFGTPVSRGVAIGRAVLVAAGRVDVAHYYVASDDVDAELARFSRARDEVESELQSLQRDLPTDARAELSALLDVHLMLLRDDMLGVAVEQWIRERHHNAEWALSAQLEIIGRQFDDMEDAYLRERKADVEQVVERLLRALTPIQSRDQAPWKAVSDAASGVNARSKREGSDDDDPLILVAADISPADMLQFKRSVFRGFVTDVGGRTSHTAIAARSLDIPAVVGAREASRIARQDDWMIIDGDAGVVIVDPSPIVMEEYRFRQREAELERAKLHRLRHAPAVTLDGQSVELLANIEMPTDAAHAVDAGAMGVGLFRSEFLFMNRGSTLPSEEEQFEAYRQAVMAMQGLPMTIRTVDVGADKPLERMSAQELRRESTMNPALGLRAIRWSLAEPHMFRMQLRAILRASAFGKVRLLIPMVAHLSEIRATFDALARAKQQLRDAGKAFAEIEVGAMIEVPAAALTLPMMMKYFDFVSIGTNDLIQYTLAIDRADEHVAHLFDPWHPAVLSLIAGTIKVGQLHGKSVAVCGEMAGDPAFTELLLGMGLRSFSMHPSQIAAIKQRVLRVDTRRWAHHCETILASESPSETAQRLMRAN